MKIKPIGERVLLKPIKLEEKTASGIILSNNSGKDAPNLAEVIAVGKGEKLDGINVGDKVVYSKFAGTDFKDKDERLIIISAEDVLAIVE